MGGQGRAADSNHPVLASDSPITQVEGCWDAPLIPNKFLIAFSDNGATGKRATAVAVLSCSACGSHEVLELLRRLVPRGRASSWPVTSSSMKGVVSPARRRPLFYLPGGVRLFVPPI